MTSSTAAALGVCSWAPVRHRAIRPESEDSVDLVAQRQGWAPGVHNQRVGIHPQKAMAASPRQCRMMMSAAHEHGVKLTVSQRVASRGRATIARRTRCAVASDP